MDYASSHVIDVGSRRVTVTPLEGHDTLRFALAIGENIKNEPYRNLVYAICSVTDIDGVPCLFPLTKYDVERCAKRIGNDGINAVLAFLMEPDAFAKANADKYCFWGIHS